MIMAAHEPLVSRLRKR